MFKAISTVEGDSVTTTHRSFKAAVEDLFDDLTLQQHLTPQVIAKLRRGEKVRIPVGGADVALEIKRRAKR